MKTISIRLPDDSIIQLEDLRKSFQNDLKGLKITQSDVIRTAILELWQIKCLPFNDDEKPYKYRAEKDIPYI